MIIGPIANDTIFDTFGILSSGFLKPEEALHRQEQEAYQASLAEAMVRRT